MSMKDPQTGELLKVQVWLHWQGKVLLLLTTAERGSFWQPVTGGVEQSDASLEAAALREAREETGLASISAPKPVGYEFTFQGKFGKARESVFECEVSEGESEVRLDPKEHTRYEWLNPEEALKRLKFEANAQPLELLVRKWKRQQEFQKLREKPWL